MELQFLDVLRSRDGSGGDESQVLLAAFIVDHASPCLEEFEAAVQENEPYEFYEAIVRLTGALVRTEADRLDIDWQSR